MALSATALLTLAQAKDYLDIKGGEKDSLLEDMVNRITDYCEGAQGANRPFKSRAYTSLRLEQRNSRKLYPLAVPISTSATLTITFDALAQTIWKTETDGDPALKDVIVAIEQTGNYHQPVASDVDDPIWRPNHLYRSAGWYTGSTSNPYPILLSYTGGLVTIPGDLLQVAFEILQKLWREQDKQMGRDTQLPSLELAMDLNPLAGVCNNGYACVYQNCLSWSSPTTPAAASPWATRSGPRATPWRRPRAARTGWSAFAAAASLVTLMPVSSSASVSFGVRMETSFRSLSGSGRAGAGLRMTRTPAFAAIAAAAWTVSNGVSSCATNTAAERMTFAAFFTSAGASSAFAPPATAMLFSPSLATKMSATPDGAALSRRT